LARDEWEIVCSLCIRASLNAGTPAYERALWRLATCTFCPRHRTPLLQIDSLSQVISDIDDYESKVLALTDLERIVAAQLFEFEREIARAFHETAPPNFDGTLTATGFLQVLKDLCDFAVYQWEVNLARRVASSLDQHASRTHAPTHSCLAPWPYGTGRFLRQQTARRMVMVGYPSEGLADTISRPLLGGLFRRR
jgi:hypothetical protein